MDKQAFLKKLAEIIVDDNGPEEENLAVGPTDEMVEADDAKVMQTPGLSEGAGNLVQAIMAQADEAANQSGAGVEVGDGDEMAEPEEDQVTKAAALDSLMDAGFSFDEAADMVKAASDAVSEQYTDMDKAAAVGELMGQGVDFDTAVEWVKEAAEGEAAAAEGMFSSLKNKAANALRSAAVNTRRATRKAMRAPGHAVDAAKDLALRNPKTALALGALGAAGLGAGAGYGAGRKMNKQAEYDDMDKAAAVGELMGQGIDFDTAVELVKEAAIRRVKTPKPAGAKPKFRRPESSATAKMAGKAEALKSTMRQTYGKVKDLAVKNPKTAIALGALGAAGTLGGVGYGVHRKMSKQAGYDDMDKAAAVGYLMDQGVDFDTAVQAVIEAAE